MADAALDVKLLVLPHGQGLPLPARASEGAAGFDLFAAVPEHEPIVLAPGARALVPAGFALALPAGAEAQIRPRSGLALKHGVTVLNAPGTIDADYRGEVKVLLINHGNAPVSLKRGEAIAQMVFARVADAVLERVNALSVTERGAGGFGSTDAQKRRAAE